MDWTVDYYSNYDNFDLVDNHLYSNKFSLRQVFLAGVNHYFAIIVQQIKSSQLLVSDERGKPEIPGKNLRAEERTVLRAEDFPRF